MATLIIFLSSVTSPADTVATQWAQVAPAPRQGAVVQRTPGQGRAVVLIPGLSPHPFSSRNVARAEWQSWQKPGSTLVKTLGRDADVFAFAYSQNVPIEQIALSQSLRQRILHLRELGYADIVLVGHSAGGLIARQFVEDYPNAGVTKVVQVCTPNGGSGWAAAPIFVRRSQEAFLASITKDARRAATVQRAAIRLPKDVECVCLLGHYDVDVGFAAKVKWKAESAAGLALAVKAAGDGLIATERQWTPDLQAQGIPGVCLRVGHFRMVRSTAGTQVIARLVRDKQPRWSAQQVSEFREKLGLDE